MREIKFRAKDTGGEWHYGDLELPRNSERNPYIHAYKENGEYDRQYPINDDTIGQFTGLCDKNGVKVFEGDVVHMVWQDLMSGRWYEKTIPVEFKWGRFTVFHLKPYEHSDKHYFEVIGNIFDNPELLNKE